MNKKIIVVTTLNTQYIEIDLSIICHTIQLQPFYKIKIFFDFVRLYRQGTISEADLLSTVLFNHVLTLSVNYNCFVILNLKCFSPLEHVSDSFDL